MHALLVLDLHGFQTENYYLKLKVSKIFRVRILESKLPICHAALSVCCSNLDWDPISTFCIAGVVSVHPASSVCSKNIT